jgi:hypothetical protein
MRCPPTPRRWPPDGWYSAWLAIPPGVEDGATTLPSVMLARMQPVRFRLRRAVR